ncbi:MAG: aldehyde dehydrogenase (NADP(+)) [Blastocatellia bacterium]
MTLTGKSILAGRRGEGQGVAQYAVDPATGEVLEPGYLPSTRAEVEEAVAAAQEAFAIYGRLTGRQKGAFLREIAARIEALGPVLTERAVRESGLPVGRIQMETGRTCHQLRMFAALVEEGSWVDARLDQPDPQRTPVPKPDVRSMKRPLGPVVIFGASNFPLAFSVAGGDTASALAAGCPVVVKAHPAHPGTSELVGLAIQEAARATGMPAGVFSLVYDSPSHEVGSWLVGHPLIRAGGFTGSRRAGLALLALAQQRPEPIPFYAEMSSVNPVFLLPGALQERAEALATGLQASVTLGAGQFCTKPGLVILADPAAAAPLIERLRALLEQTPPQTMLTAAIGQGYTTAIEARHGHPAITPHLAATREGAPLGKCQAVPALHEVDAEAFLANPQLADEIFGPVTLLVVASSPEQLTQIVAGLEGQLTATVHGTEADLAAHRDLVALLTTKVGRLVWNGFPTGVEVGAAMVHGGPFPSTSDGRSTSVGTRAIDRFTRPVCYQGCPEELLPPELRRANPLQILRQVDGQMTRDSLA